MAKENTMGNCPDQALVQRAKNGDTDALAQLITRFLPLIKTELHAILLWVWNRMILFRKG